MLARRLSIRLTGLCGEIFPGYPGSFIRMATNGVDDHQQTMAHCRWQRRPSVDHTLKIRWNGCVLVRAMRRIMRRLFLKFAYISGNCDIVRVLYRRF